MKKKNTHTQIHEILQFFSTIFHFLKLLHNGSLLVVIIYCQCGRCDYFILLYLYNIFIFMQLSLNICHFFYKNILDSMTKLNPLALHYLLTHTFTLIHALNVYLTNQIFEQSLILPFFFLFLNH